MTQANWRIDEKLKSLMFVEVFIIVLVCLGQYLILRRFINKMRIK